MCYANMITWEKCGHFRVITQMCAKASQAQPPTLCSNAHEPVATDIDSGRGVCPDLTKHPNAESDSKTYAWARNLGITSTCKKAPLPFLGNGKD